MTQPLTFAPEISYMELQNLPADHPESRVRHIANNSVEQAVGIHLKNENNLQILRESLRRELESGTPRTSLTTPLRAKIKRLKAQAAAKVEIIELNDTLTDCAQGINTASTRIEQEFARFDRATKYDRILIGLWLLKAKHIHLRPTVGRRDETTGRLASASGFQTWLKSDVPHIKQSTAYNYINAALNAGLTITSTPDDVAALKKAGTLDTVPVKQLYAPPSADDDEDDDLLNIEETPDPAPEHTQSKFLLIRDTLVATREECTNLVNIRDEMSPAALETACARLLHTLEELTGSKWCTTDAEHAATLTEHPEAYELGS